MSLSCAALLVFRNELRTLEQLLPLWLQEGLELVAIDHDSSDGSREFLESQLGCGVLSLGRLPWLGHFSLRQQLEAKARAIEQLRHDWVLHLDADEWPQSNRTEESLVQAIERLAASGANAVNFEEFVFLPLQAAAPECLHYYHFAPAKQRLVRAWQRRQRFTNVNQGGHRLAINTAGEQPEIAAESLVLRHYIVQSEAQAAQKYLGRVFAAEELGQGWHRNRIGLSRRQLLFPQPGLLNQLKDVNDRPKTTGEAHTLHYWHWPDSSKRRPPRTVVCLYGCDADAELLPVFEASPLAALLRERADCLVLQVWAGGDQQPSLEGNRLTLPVPEAYEQLSRKTWRMLRYCSRHWQFEQLIKLDLSCVRQRWEGAAYAGRKPLNLEALCAYLELRLNAPLPQPSLGNPDYDGFLRHAHPRRQDVEAWGARKGAQLNLNRIWPGGEDPPSFFSGKCYAVSADLARYISAHGRAMAGQHKRHLHGAEDMMVARLALDFQAQRSA